MTPTSHRRSLVKSKNISRHLTIIEFRAMAFVTTLILAGIAIILDVEEPVVWTFLGTAIGILSAQTNK